MKKLVIINETHSLFPEQIELLNKRFGKNNWERLDIPNSGLTLNEISNLSIKLMQEDEIVISSPIPALFVKLKNSSVNWLVFHNDKREKVEIPGGKIITKIADTGWQLI